MLFIRKAKAFPEVQADFRSHIIGQINATQALLITIVPYKLYWKGIKKKKQKQTKTQKNKLKKVLKQGSFGIPNENKYRKMSDQ